MDGETDCKTHVPLEQERNPLGGVKEQRRLLLVGWVMARGGCGNNVLVFAVRPRRDARRDLPGSTTGTSTVLREKRRKLTTKVARSVAHACVL